MTAAGLPALSQYLQSVDGYSTGIACATAAYSIAFAGYYANNCPSLAAAAIYGSCLCSKAGSNILQSAASYCTGVYQCTNGETAIVSSFYTAFCSSATILARAIATTTAAITTGTSTSISPARSSSTSTLLTSNAAGNIGPISSVGSGTNPSTSSGSSALGIGAIIAIAVVVGMVALAAIACCSYFTMRHVKGQRQKRLAREKQEQQQQGQQSVGAVPLATLSAHASGAGSDHHSGPQTAQEAIDDWRRDSQGRLYQYGPGPQSQLSGSIAPSQIFSDGSRRGVPTGR